MSRILASGQRPTAIFAASDRLAIGAIQAAFQKGLQVPGDISIIGLDDIETAAYQVPPLTTVRQSFGELGTRAVRLLLELLETKQVEQAHIIIEPVLVTRQSTARLAKENRGKRH
jgi:DNA-binding LacI/PurR family transcriptional regulator